MKFNESPYGLVLHQEPLDRKRDLMVSVPVLAKRAEYARGVHSTGSKFRYPLRRLVHDSNAVVGDHSRCLHFAPNPDAARRLRGYGDHLLVTLPGPHHWGRRCHHSDGAMPLFCATCEDIGWRVMGLPEAAREYVPPSLRQQLLEAAGKGAISSVAHEIPRTAVARTASGPLLARRL